MSDNPSGEEFRAESSTQSSSPKNNNGLWIVLGCLGGGGLSMVFLGIVMAIALPSFLNQANRAKQTEAQTYVRAMSRAQQAEFIENGEFTPSMGKLQLGLGDSTIYRYGLEVEPSGTHVLITATPLTDPINHYIGAVFRVGDSPETTTTVTQICEGSAAFTAAPTFNPATSEIDCPPGSTPL
ncbi:MAG: type IV pilin-like G/H family protein [Cyanobacteria bacterium P01_C01_bin.147]